MGEELKWNHVKYGTCRFCGQTRQYTDASLLEQENVDQRATMECDCEGAKIHAHNKIIEDNKCRAQAEQLLKANQKIEELFGKKAMAFGYVPAKEVQRELLSNYAEQVCNNVIEGITVVLNNTKAKINAAAGGGLSISRIDNTTTKVEVQR